MENKHTPMTSKELCSLREKMKLTWVQLAEELGVTDRALYFYAEGSRTPPKPIARLLRILSGKECLL